MPRPGPRPYECVRKAWHSDRHLPIRGSLIQEIFRLANELHKPPTKKNKEWEEKLPTVVLRAEEIMYSKANSEAEYIDLSTLRDRVNDAINTIIRSDTESSEDGKFLQPCIEAALQLGCIPRKSSRSQRYSDPGCYLTSPTRDNPSFPTYPESLPNRSPHIPFVPPQSNFVAVTSKDNSPTCLAPYKFVDQQYTCSNPKILCSRKSYSPSGTLKGLTTQPHSTRNSYSNYPLHLGDPVNPENYIFYSKTPTTPKPHLIAPQIMGGRQNGSPIRNVNETKCDLSLRLGQLAKPCTSNASPWSQEVEISGSISSQRQRRRL